MLLERPRGGGRGGEKVDEEEASQLLLMLIVYSLVLQWILYVRQSTWLLGGLGLEVDSLVVLLVNVRSYVHVCCAVSPSLWSSTGPDAPHRGRYGPEGQFWFDSGYMLRQFTEAFGVFLAA